jgi:shikimate dehydrogenase
VLGAGGSARAVVWALREAGAGEVLVCNRTPARARQLCAQLGATPVRRPPAGAGVLVNCTSVGLSDPAATFKDLPVAADEMTSYGCVVDLVYRPGGTALIAAARRAGRPTVDGLEILIRQGALSLERWTGRAAPLDVMRTAARTDAST